MKRSPFPRLLAACLPAALFCAAPSVVWAEVTLRVTPLQDGRDVDFGNAHSLGPNGEQESDTVVRQVRITVTSTSSKTYQVLYSIHDPWKNLSGEELPLKNVLFYVSEIETGTTGAPSPVPLEMGERELFLSDPSGSSEEFLVTYTVRVPPGQKAGPYSTHIAYRVISQ